MVEGGPHVCHVWQLTCTLLLYGGEGPSHVELELQMWLRSGPGRRLDLELQPWLRPRSRPACELDLDPWLWLRSRSRPARDEI